MQKTEKPKKANKQLLEQIRTTKINELKEYAFNKIRDPRHGLITEDSLRNALNQHDVPDVNEDVLTHMFNMATKD
jgi:hypothetical protein